jgi:hypothetical protein
MRVRYVLIGLAILAIGPGLKAAEITADDLYSSCISSRVAHRDECSEYVLRVVRGLSSANIYLRATETCLCP